MQHEPKREKLRDLHIELLKMQRWVTESGARVLALFEGRDAAGKGGAIQRITKHLNPRNCTIVALGTPTQQERGQWYFQRYVAYLPAAGEIALFDRSWYNRAGIERVMGFCSPEQVEEFLEAVPDFERLLVRDGILLFKFYFSIDQEVQEQRLERRRTNPLKQWKLTPLDEEGQRRWGDYTRAEEEMFRRTSTASAPWIRVDGNDKGRARIEVMHYLLHHLDYPDKATTLRPPDPTVIQPVPEGNAGP